MANPFRNNKNKPAATQAPAARPVPAPAAATPAVAPQATLNTQPAANMSANKPSVRIESKPAGEPSSVTPSAIAEAAYFLWLQRGGSETNNWLEAERMLKTKVAATAPAR